MSFNQKEIGQRVNELRTGHQLSLDQLADWSRKTFISSLIDAGMNINTIREWVGHAEEQTTWGSYCYDRRTTDERREILESALSS